MRCNRLASALVLACAPVACDSSHSSAAGDQSLRVTTHAVERLRVTADPAGPPRFILHWDLDPAPHSVAPVGFRVYLGPAPIDATNQAAQLVATVPGDVRSAAIVLRGDTGFRFAAVQSVGAGTTVGPISLSLPLDTDRRLAFATTTPTGTALYVTGPNAPEPTRIATHVESHGWTPGSRAFIYVDMLEGRARAYPVSTPPGDPALITKTVSIPDVEVGRHWTSVRVAGTGAVAYHRPAGGGQALEVRDADGQSRQVSAAGEDVQQFAWSPDGTRLIYLRPGTALQQHLHSVSVDGTDNRQINPDLGDDEYVLVADWSPDGAHLAFQVVDASSASSGTLYVHQVATGQTTRVASGIALDLVWSPRGNHLLFSGPHPVPNQSSTRAIFLLPVPWDPTLPPAGQLLLREPSPTDLFGFNWSPDGTRVAYFRQSGAAQRVLHVFAPFEPTTRYAVDLPAGEAPLRHSWSADSHHLACVVQRSTEQGVRVFDFAAGGSQVPSTVWVDAPAIGHLAWSPLGADLGLILQHGRRFHLYVTRGAGLVDLSPDSDEDTPVVDFRWSDWAMPRHTWIYSKLVMK